MKTILVIHDNSPNAAHATEFAFALAQIVRADILMANTVSVKNNSALIVTAGIDYEPLLEKGHVALKQGYLNIPDDIQNSYKPEVKEMNISGMDVSKVAELVNKNQIWMVIKGMIKALPSSDAAGKLNIHSVLNRILCPVLLIPENWSLKHIERLVYVADLRYCRTQIVRYLAELAKSYQASLSIAHVTAEGLPDMAESYALSLFSEVVCSNVNYDQLYFNNIKEKNLGKTLDVIIHGMQNDMLVLINRHFHFEEIMGPYITETLPPNITVPVLIFPC